MGKEAFTSRRVQVITKLLHSLVGGFKSNTEQKLKKNEVKLLLELNFHPNQPLKHYVDAVGMEFGSFTYLSDKLIKKGYVVKVPSTTDKRVTILSLTEEGDKLAMEICRQFQDHVLSKIDSLEPAYQKKLNQAFKLVDEVYTHLLDGKDN